MFRPSRRIAALKSTAPFWAAVVIVSITMLAADVAIACPNCKDAVNTADPDGLNLARGYFYSILIMLAMPCTLVGSFGVYVWREMQKQKREAGGAADPATASHAPAFPPEPATSPHS